MLDLLVAQQIADDVRSELDRWRSIYPHKYDGSDIVIESKRLALWRNGFQGFDPAHLGPEGAPPPKDFMHS